LDLVGFQEKMEHLGAREKLVPQDERVLLVKRVKRENQEDQVQKEVMAHRDLVVCQEILDQREKLEPLEAEVKMASLGQLENRVTLDYQEQVV